MYMQFTGQMKSKNRTAPEHLLMANTLSWKESRKEADKIWGQGLVEIKLDTHVIKLNLAFQG